MLTYMEVAFLAMFGIVAFLVMFGITTYSILLAYHYYRKLMNIYEGKNTKRRGSK